MKATHMQAKYGRILSGVFVFLMLAVTTIGSAEIVQINTFEELKAVASNPNATIIQIMKDIKVTETVHFTMNNEQLLITSFSDTDPMAKYEISWDANSGNASRLFLFDRGDGGDMSVTLDSLSFTGGNVNGGGGAVKIIGDATIANCDFSDNIANFGGAVYVTGNVDVSDSTFLENYANADGGALYVQGGDVSILNTEFQLNSAMGEGGAIAILKGDLDISDSIFTGNTASTGGGVSIILQGDVDVINSTFENNAATYVGDGYGGGGGGIFSQEGNVNINGSVFVDNDALYGGGVYVSDGNAAINDSSFIDNTAVMGGGGAYLSSNEDGTVTITGTEFTGNEAAEGGGLHLNNGEIDISNCVFEDNTADVGAAILNGAMISLDSFDGFSGNEPDGNETHGIESVNGGRLIMKSQPHSEEDDDDDDEGSNTGSTEGGSHSNQGNLNGVMTSITSRGSYGTGGHTNQEKQYEKAIIRAKKGYANVYEGPGKGAEVIDYVPDGEIVSLSLWNSSESICKVFYANDTRLGWVEGKYIVPIK